MVVSICIYGTDVVIAQFWGIYVFFYGKDRYLDIYLFVGVVPSGGFMRSHGVSVCILPSSKIIDGERELL